MKQTETSPIGCVKPTKTAAKFDGMFFLEFDENAGKTLTTDIEGKSSGAQEIKKASRIEGFYFFFELCPCPKQKDCSVDYGSDGKNIV